jgi:hypothetical protein
MAEYFDLEVSLEGIKPRIWRRFLLAGDATFGDLHEAIQDSFGWESDHLYEFRDKKGRQTIARADFEGAGDEGSPTVDEVDLAFFFKKKGTKCQYVYDFGDNWQHAVELKGVVELPDTFGRRLLDGARACPPEDCGGIWGYEQCCEIAAMSDDDIKKVKGKAAELEERKEWLGDWHPEEFDLAEAKKEFDEVGSR